MTNYMLLTQLERELKDGNDHPNMQTNARSACLGNVGPWVSGEFLGINLLPI